MTLGTYRKAKGANAKTSTMVATEYHRNQFLKATAPNKMLSSTKGFIARSACIVSVNVGSTPRICIGKKFHSSRVSITFANIASAIARMARLFPDDAHTPNAKTANRPLESVKSETTR